MFKKAQFLSFLVIILIAGNVSAGTWQSICEFFKGKKQVQPVTTQDKKVDPCDGCYYGNVVVLKPGESIMDFVVKHSNCSDIPGIAIMAKFNGISDAVSPMTEYRNVRIPTLKQADSIRNILEFKQSPKKPKIVSDEPKPIIKKPQPTVQETKKVQQVGPFHWKHPGADPTIYNSPEQVWVKMSFSKKEGVLDSLQAKVERGDCILNYKSYKGEGWIEMSGGREIDIYGKDGRGVLNDFTNLEYIEGTMYEVDYSPTQIAQIFKANNCDNWCWRLVDRPIEPPCDTVRAPDTVRVHDTTKVVEKVPQYVVPSVPVAPPKDERGIYGECFLWTGYYAPLPVIHHGHFYLGGIGNVFAPIGKFSGLGLSLKANGYAGWSPRFYDKKGNPFFGDYAGALVGIGPILDLQSRSKNLNSGINTRTTFAGRVYWQHDWYQNQHDKYWNRQGPRSFAPQSFGPEVTSYIANSNWTKWVQGWIGYRQDVAFVNGNLWYVYREAHLNGEKRALQDEPPCNKTVIDWGVGVFPWPVFKGSSTLGIQHKGDHMLEDNRWEFSLGFSLRVKKFFFGAGVKETIESVYKNQNGRSIYLSIDFDPTPRNQQKKVIVQESAPITEELHVDENRYVAPEPEADSDDDPFRDLIDDPNSGNQNQENSADSNYVPSIPFQR
ncbi:MAG: hypothetical protein WC415_00920 [Patescibacteria group bacterium]|jgi:hypothetical protein